MRLTHIVEGFNRDNKNLSRPLIESIIVPEVTAALKKWIGSGNIPGVLIGGLALSFYAKPRYTADIDVLFLSDQDIPSQISGFKRIRSHSFQHNNTHVEVEVLSPSFLGLPEGLVQKVTETAIDSSGMRVASPSGLVALKLFRNTLKDDADIQDLLLTGKVDLQPFTPWLNQQQIKRFENIQKRTENRNNET